MFKPLLAATVEDASLLTWPMLASPKLDGIRAMVIDGKLVSRTMKLIPNKHTYAMFSKPEYEGLDGELIVGDPTAPDAYNRSTSGVMRGSGEPDVTFWVFDKIPNGEYKGCFHWRFVQMVILAEPLPGVKVVPHENVKDLTQFTAYEEKMVGRGYEGVMLRDPLGQYKFGRSTLNSRHLLKVKRFTDDEAVITGLIQQMHNGNEATKDAFGRTERSSAKAGLVPTGKLGALSVRNTAGQEFEIGTGFNDADRKSIWSAQDMIGKIVKYRYQSAGMKDLPRFPSFVGFRED